MHDVRSLAEVTRRCLSSDKLLCHCCLGEFWCLQIRQTSACCSQSRVRPQPWCCHWCQCSCVTSKNRKLKAVARVEAWKQQRYQGYQSARSARLLVGMQTPSAARKRCLAESGGIQQRWWYWYWCLVVDLEANMVVVRAINAFWTSDSFFGHLSFWSLSLLDKILRAGLNSLSPKEPKSSLMMTLEARTKEEILLDLENIRYQRTNAKWLFETCQDCRIPVSIDRISLHP